MYQYTSDKYGNYPLEFRSPDEFVKDCLEAGMSVSLTQHTDGDKDYYTDQDGEVVLVEI